MTRPMEPWQMKILEEALGELGAARRQSIPSDDQIIRSRESGLREGWAGFVRRAHARRWDNGRAEKRVLRCMWRGLSPRKSPAPYFCGLGRHHEQAR